MSKSIQLMDSLSAQDPKPLLPRQLTNASLSIADPSRRYSLSELLPYDPQAKTGERLIAGLKEYDFLLTTAELSIQLLSKEQISCFDPLVGENACQIRALKNCLIFSKYPVNINELLVKIQSARKKIDELFGKASQLKESHISLGNILEDADIDIQLTYSEIYLIKSYLLTVVKTIKPPKEDIPFIKNEYTDTKKLKSIKPIGTMFAESLIKKLRESLSAFSVSFVQELSSKLAPKSLASAMSDKFYIRHNRLHCLPCYWVTKLLMIQAQKSQIPLIIIARQLATDQNYKIIREMPLSFKTNLFGYKYTSFDSFNSKAPTLVLLVNTCRKSHEFSELTEWKKELLKYNPIDLVLAYAASHRQYPDITKNDLLNQIQDKEYEFYKKKALDWGCSIEDPSGFFLSHAFCDKIENIANHVSLPETKLHFFTPVASPTAQFIDERLFTYT